MVLETLAQFFLNENENQKQKKKNTKHKIILSLNGNNREEFMNIHRNDSVSQEKGKPKKIAYKSYLGSIDELAVVGILLVGSLRLDAWKLLQTHPLI